MSALTNFISKLAPRIQKNTVEEDLKSAIKELSDFAIPMAKEMSNQNSLTPFKSTFYKSLSSNFYNHVKMRKQTDLWMDVATALLQVQANAESLLSMAKGYLQEDTLRDGITARAANMLRMVSAISFISSYVTEASDYQLTQEAVELGDSDENAPNQAKYIWANMERFSRLIADASIPSKDFERMFGDIPDVYLSEKNSQAIAGMFTDRQLDPFAKMSGTSGWSGSPIFTIRMMWETYQAERFHAAKERKSMLELRLIHLNNLQNNSTNPRLQKEIEGLENRIRKYDIKIRKIEDSVFNN